MSANIGKVQGGIFNDILLWVRRIIKSSNSSSITNETIAQYVNRFYVYDLPERLQLLELKRQYTFETLPNIMEYQAPFTTATSPAFPANASPPPFINNPNPPANQTVMPIYQNFMPPIYCDGVQMGWVQSNEQFYSIFPEFVNNEDPAIGDGTTVSFATTAGASPILQAFIDDLGTLKPYVFITALNSAGTMMYIVDTPYKNSAGLGILVQTDSTFQNIIAGISMTNPSLITGIGTVNYSTGQLTFTFNSPPANQTNIETQTSPFSPGVPRYCLFFNNTFKLYPVPQRQYKIQVDAYVTPTVFFNTGASVPFAYMSEYIARGAARKILADSGDMQQLEEMEPFFKEQENLVLRRSDRQRAVMRTPTIFSNQTSNNTYTFTQY